jgi:hypothetical protein
MPELLQYAITQEKMRSVRLDANPEIVNSVIAKSEGSCDFKQVIQLLSSIRGYIGTVNDSSHCNKILGILSDVCNVPSIGENRSITECCAEIHENFEGTWTILANLDITKAVDLSGVYTMIEARCAHESIPLFQSVVDIFGDLIIFNPGNYHLAENITGNILVSAVNVTLDGNGYALTGCVDIGTANAIVKNLTITPVAPVNSGAANLSAIFLRSGADNAQILNCMIVCANTTATNVPGRSGISGFGGFGLGNKTWIKDCNITAGNGNGIGAGGNGISISGSYPWISNTIVIAGSGSAGGSIGGAGGVGVSISGTSARIENSRFQGGNAGNGTGPAAAGGDGATMSGANALIENSQFQGGNGGNVTTSGTGGNGGAGASMTGAYARIDSSQFQAGSGGTTVSGVGGTGGRGVLASNLNFEIYDSTVFGGNGGNAIAGAGGFAETGIRIEGPNTSNCVVKNCKAVSGNGGNGTTNGAPGSAGILLRGPNGTNPASNAVVTDCVVQGGNGGTATSGAGGAGGQGIDIFDYARVIVQSCHVPGGSNGGNSTSGTGGAGGSGIYVRGSTSNIVQITDCRVENTGTVGTGGTPTQGSGIGINAGSNIQITNNNVLSCAGSGILIALGLTNVQVMSNRVSNCGNGFFSVVGTQAVFGNNTATGNTVGNYVGVPVATIGTLNPPSPGLNYWTNVIS